MRRNRHGELEEGAGACQAPSSKNIKLAEQPTYLPILLSKLLLSKPILMMDNDAHEQASHRWWVQSQGPARRPHRCRLPSVHVNLRHSEARLPPLSP